MPSSSVLSGDCDFPGQVGPISERWGSLRVFKRPRVLASAWVYPVNWLRGCMEVMRGRGLAEISRLPGARIKFRVAIGLSA